MKTTLLCAAIVSALTATLNAADITWQSPQSIVNDFDVNTLGTLYGAWNPYNGSPQDVNGVSFSGGLPGISITAGFTDGYTAYPASPSGSSAYNADLACGAYTYGGVDTFSWNGMTAGDTYLVQLWLNTGHSERTDTITGGSNSVNVNEAGYYVIGTFMADVTGSQEISMTGPYPNLNMIQVRDITPVPEPSTAAILSGGFGLLLLGFRRKNRMG